MTDVCNILKLPEGFESVIADAVESVKHSLIPRPKVKIMGKVCHQNRDVRFFSDRVRYYPYSGAHMESCQMMEPLRVLLNLVNWMYGSDFNGILVNRYNIGSDYIGAHRDAENCLDAKSGVVIVSYGVDRILRFRDADNNIVRDVHTSEGIIQITPEQMRAYTHEIPKQMKVEGVRYSFTFRKHAEAPKMTPEEFMDEFRELVKRKCRHPLDTGIRLSTRSVFRFEVWSEDGIREQKWFDDWKIKHQLKLEQIDCCVIGIV